MEGEGEGKATHRRYFTLRPFSRGVLPVTFTESGYTYPSRHGQKTFEWSGSIS